MLYQQEANTATEIRTRIDRLIQEKQPRMYVKLVILLYCIYSLIIQ